jgi:hypothetical protein
LLETSLSSQYWMTNDSCDLTGQQIWINNNGVRKWHYLSWSFKNWLKAYRHQ